MTQDGKKNYMHCEVSSMGPLQFRKNGTVQRLLTLKRETEHGNEFLGAFLVTDDALHGDIKLGRNMVISYETKSSGERIITDYYYE